MTPPKENACNYSRYDLTWGPRKARVAPPPVQKLVFQVSINSCETRTEGFLGLKEYTVYKVATVHRTSDNDIKHAVAYKRYSDFLALYDKLAERYGWIRLPQLPGKKFFGNMNDRFVSQRRHQLARFLENLVDWRDNDADIVSFLGIGKEAILTGDLKGSHHSYNAQRSCLRNGTSSCRSRNAVSWGRNTTYEKYDVPEYEARSI